MTTLTRTKWFLPLFSLALGVLMLVAQWIGGDPGSGLASLAIMAALGVVFLAGGRSETIRGLRGDGRDERFCQLDIRATAFAGTAAIAAIIVGFMVDVATGGNGAPYTWLGAIAGVAYLGAVVYQRIRS
ncbi:MAG TPA: hypothetical protein VHB25_15995 [Gemmatimonadaceae bacterium]|nr:hypothetical protein [Gemmatimonadaceae bacterium]